MICETIKDAADLGRAVRLARRASGLSQRALAKQCGCSQRFISEAETSGARGGAGEAVGAVPRRVARGLAKDGPRVALSDYL